MNIADHPQSVMCDENVLVQQDSPSSSCSGAINPMTDRCGKSTNPLHVNAVLTCVITLQLSLDGQKEYRLRDPNPPLSLSLSPPTPKHNGVNNTAERDLALQKERLAFLVHHVDWRDQFTFVLSLASPPPAGIFQGRVASRQVYPSALMQTLKSPGRRC